MTANGLHLDARVDAATLLGNRQLLHQLVANLLNNAIRHNIAGGDIELTVTPGATGADEPVGAAGAGVKGAGVTSVKGAGVTGARLSVTNTGPPVAPDEVGRLIQPFQRGRPDRTASPDGLGLGLAIVAEIAAAHDAHLHIDPRPEGGLAITVTFPGRPGGGP